jgi:hypothetical protein
MVARPMIDVATVKANRREWTCKDCGFVNTCWCFVCHGCEDVTSLDG